MNNVIHAEMFFNNQRALAEQTKKLANPRDNWTADETIAEKRTLRDIMSNEIPLIDDKIGRLQLTREAIQREIATLTSEIEAKENES